MSSIFLNSIHSPRDPMRDLYCEVWTFECKRGLFYSCRILGHISVHIHYATIQYVLKKTPKTILDNLADRNSTDGLPSLTYKCLNLESQWAVFILADDWARGGWDWSTRYAVSIIWQIFILFSQLFILKAHLYLFIYCYKVSPLK